MKTLTDKQWEQVVNALTFFIDVQTEELRKQNVGDREWQELKDYEGTLNDILFYVLHRDNKFETVRGSTVIIRK